MRAPPLLIAALTLLATPLAIAGPDCANRSLPQALPMPATLLPPLSRELPLADHSLGMPDAMFSAVGDDAQAVDVVLARLRAQACVPAVATDAATGPAAGYVPRTKWDNTPYRFNAGGNGKKFTAADFDAWMQANGIHVAKGVPQPVAAPAADTPAAAPAAPPKP